MTRYICIKCYKEFDESELKVMLSTRCPYCGYRVIAKSRSSEIKILKAI
ncbi:MAG: DNA-directed RNA polymerase subunit P [Ignisphaera sp.]|uniref:DNA-directed RNA polymerase subunit Rpo12 n=1 Tax=Ignisphaera aggregans TaxID=334771 RepID=A0A7J3MWI4_9CREN